MRTPDSQSAKRPLSIKPLPVMSRIDAGPEARSALFVRVGFHLPLRVCTASAASSAAPRSAANTAGFRGFLTVPAAVFISAGVETQERKRAADAVLCACSECGATNRIVADARQRRSPVWALPREDLPAPHRRGHRRHLAPRGRAEHRSRCWSTSGRRGAAPAGWSAPILDELARRARRESEDREAQRRREPALSARFGVQAIPTMILFRGRRELDQIRGAVPKPEMEGRLARFDLAA